jgi:hypothetical protein
MFIYFIGMQICYTYMSWFAMSRYMFQVINTEYIAVDAPSLEEALEQAGKRPRFI